MSKVGRNETCPCGSGKKYKHCCESKPTGHRMTMVMILVIAGAIAAAVLASVFTEGESSAGPGRVWSAEHGHYH
jgi:hypothetical protein